MKNFLFGLLLLPAIVGMVFIYHTLVINKSDGHTGKITNRVARLELAWLAMNKPHLFKEIMPELAMDIANNRNVSQRNRERFLLKSSAFDYKYFVAHNPDLQIIIAQGENAVKQYWLENLHECRESSPVFNVKLYLKRYSDLVNAFGLDCERATYHWFESGIYEGRTGM